MNPAPHIKGLHFPCVVDAVPLAPFLRLTLKGPLLLLHSLRGCIIKNSYFVCGASKSAARIICRQRFRGATGIFYHKRVLSCLQSHMLRPADFHRVLTVENPELILATAVQSALTVENPKMVLATACFLLLRQKRDSKNKIAKTGNK